MSGEQAAASLFGSDDASSDPFASLGTTFEATDADDFFAGKADSAFTVDEADPFVQPAVIPSEQGTQVQNEYSYQNGSQTTSMTYDPYKPAQSYYSQPTNQSAYSVNSSQSPTAAISNRGVTYSNTYTSQTYAPSAPISQPSPPAANNYYASPYAPPATPNYAPQNVYSPPATAIYAPTTTPYGGTVSAPPPPPPVKKVPITRPAVSNAYDPPFLPSTRRVSKTVPAQPTYSAYQTASPSVNNYTPPPPPPPAGNQQLSQHQNHAYGSQEYQQVSPEVPLQQKSGPPPPFRTASPYSNAYAPPPLAPRQAPSQRPYSPTISAVSPIKDQVVATSPPTSTNGNHDVHAHQRYASPVGSLGRPASRSHARNGSVGSSVSAPKSDPGAASPPPVTSPSMIPLPYSPPPGTQSPEVLSSPEFVTKSPPSQYSPYAPPPAPQLTQTVAQSQPPTLVRKTTHDPYAPSAAAQFANQYIPRTSSPLQKEYNPAQSRKSSLSTNLNGSVSSTYNTVSKTLNHIPKPLSLDDPSHHALSPPQEHGIRPTVSQYAPSPSLLGANDPLARTSARAPVITFGFGGKLVTCFHGMPGLNTGFDVALSARTTSELKVRILQKILPESALNTAGTAYPGPLVSDADTSSLSLIKSGANTQAKNKKTALLAYLNSRADEISQGLGYLTPDRRRLSESKLILVKILKALVEYDGRLLGVPKAEMSVRHALVPHLDGESTLQDGMSLQAAYQVGPSDEIALSVTSLSSSMLEKIKDFLLQGDRRQAYHYAMDQKLWAHAMVIASSIDKDAWKEVVNEFLQAELASAEPQSKNMPLDGAKSWESLRMAYSLFSGQGSASVQELAAPASLQKMATMGLLTPAAPSIASTTPRTPNFAAIQPPMNIPTETLAKWAETVAMIVSSPLTSETSAALTALGDQLSTHGWVDAAHACYLLSPQTSAVAGHGIPGARVTLVGTKNPATAFRDPDTVIFSEILEFTMSLVPASKGQDVFHGLPHLQAYRFIRATWLAEIGDIQLSNRYCEAIAASLSQNSPFTTPALVDQLNNLKQRLSGVFHGDKSGSWIGNKLTKPSLGSVGGWLEGRFTKLVTGDLDSSDSNVDQPTESDSHFGPFAHYSTISSATPSESSSPQPQSHVPAYASSGITYSRTSSDMSNSSPYAPPPERTGSASGYGRPRLSTQSSISSQYSPQVSNGHANDPYSAKTSTSDEVETPVQGTSWWGPDGDSQNTQTPTASSFMHSAESVETNPDGFISLMDNQSFAFESGPPSRQSNTPQHDADIDDDLGLGNSKSKIESLGNHGTASPTAAAPATQQAALPEKKVEEKPASSGWFSRIWSRSESTGPVKANLGEQSAFYFDKDLKRWVNKTSGAEEAKSSPPPPPPRSQTASPGTSLMGRSMPPPPAGTGPPSRSSSASPGGPPPRPASAIDLSTEPPSKVPPRIRSNLAPPSAESLPGTPTTPGPPSRPRSQASRKNVRSRYVDVFSQEGGAGSS